MILAFFLVYLTKLSQVYELSIADCKNGTEGYIGRICKEAALIDLNLFHAIHEISHFRETARPFWITLICIAVHLNHFSF